MRAHNGTHILEIQHLDHAEIERYEKLLANALKQVITELAFTNAGLMLSYVSAGQESIIADILASSAEMSLKPGILRYGHQATSSAEWGTAPVMSLSLELHHATLSAFFRLVFDQFAIGVDIDSIRFARATGSPEEDLACFAAALEDMRITKQ
ncbi:hypothetical protein [Roseixanthobacter liquoris]|uniref:hypothetical protein n=1 Tax=Roseixanthobacter liquoris TaxID=3119921 RepID=UPI00372B38A6